MRMNIGAGFVGSRMVEKHLKGHKSMGNKSKKIGFRNLGGGQWPHWPPPAAGPVNCSLNANFLSPCYAFSVPGRPSASMFPDNSKFTGSVISIVGWWFT